MLLRQMLYRCEIRFLPVIAGFWTRTRPLPDYEELIRILCDRMLDPAVLHRFFEGEAGRQTAPGLKRLIAKGGTETAESFEAAFGPLRVAGIEKIHREKLWKDPVSVTENLWYRGLIFRENRFVADELKECYILPDDLSAVLSGILAGDDLPPAPAPVPLVIRPAGPDETANAFKPDTKLPDMLTLAAALQREDRPLEFPGLTLSDPYIRFLRFLLTEQGMFSPEGEGDSERIRAFLTENRTAARLESIRAWRNSGTYNELTEERVYLNTVVSPGFDTTVPRCRLLEMLGQLPPDSWWSLDGFIAAVKKARPEFLRSAFDGERGQIYDPEGNDLSGMGSWFQLEGAYIRFILFGPLNWLGIVQTAEAGSMPSAFRISREGLFYLLESGNAALSDPIREKPNLEHGFPNVSADGAITCSDKVPRYFRYMAARCCEIEKVREDLYTFRLTPASLALAERSGITRDSFLKLLQRFSGKALPPSLEHMLSGTVRSGLPATIYQATILTVPDAEILGSLLDTSRLGKWILQQINSNSLLIDPKGINEIRRFLMEKEIFVDIQSQSS